MIIFITLLNTSDYKKIIGITHTPLFAFYKEIEAFELSCRNRYSGLISICVRYITNLINTNSRVSSLILFKILALDKYYAVSEIIGKKRRCALD